MDFYEFLQIPHKYAPERQHEGKSARSCVEARHQVNRLIYNSPMRAAPEFPPKSYISPPLQKNEARNRSSQAKFAHAAVHKRESMDSVGMSGRILDDEASFKHNPAGCNEFCSLFESNQNNYQSPEPFKPVNRGQSSESYTSEQKSSNGKTIGQRSMNSNRQQTNSMKRR